MKKTCLDCGSSLKGRSDKKFCSDFCRNNFHNRQNQLTNNYVRRINYVLRKNRRILERLNEHGLDKVQRNALVREGFDFEYVTSVVQNGKDTTLYFCYEHGYQVLENDFVELIRKNDNLWFV
ncbi:MAG: hypothetical protein KFF73_09430 [Cyclobacteriaceae bacterium]|nr:hypothetical protein [Cyclobacteriaceae bacterium]